MKLVDGLIYKVTNNTNGKVYIGQTIRSLATRWNRHKRDSACTRLAGAIKKYGKENFSIEIIDRANNTDELNKKEIFWIAHYKSNDRRNGYNIQLGGRCGNSDHYKLSEEDERDIERLDSIGVTHIEIGHMFGINRKTVTFILKRRISYINKRVKVEDRVDIEEIEAYLKAYNPTLAECRKKFKIGNKSIYRISEKIGHKFPARGERR